MLLTYTTGRQEALGQCRIGLAMSVEIMHPAVFHWRQHLFEDGTCGVSVRLSKDLTESSDEVEWQSTEMAGALTWWFNHTSVILCISSE
jgi:hypothetical protein